MELKDLIINKPELVCKKQKLKFALIFLLFWAVFLYLLKPFIIFLGWLIGINTFITTISQDATFWQVSVEPVLGYFTFIGIMLIVFPSWIIFNKRAYSGARDERRNDPHLIVKEKVAHDMNVPLSVANLLQESKYIVYYFDNQAGITATNIDGRHIDIAAQV